MLYQNGFIPSYVPALYIPPPKCKKKKKKKTKFALYAAPYKKKRYSLTFYLKYVLWKKFRRYWKKRRARNKKKKISKAPSVPVLSNKGSEEKIDLRDFWGSRYGSQWLFAKEMHQGVNRNHLIEIIDAFKTKDLKYANRHSTGQRYINSIRRSLTDCQDRKKFDQISRRSSKCPCCPESRYKYSGDTDSSDWSLSTVHCQQRLLSKWPSSYPSNSKSNCAKLEQFTTILSRQHAYLYNWLNADQSQNRFQLTMSKEYLDKIRRRIDSSRSGSRKQGTMSQTSCSCSESGSCSSTISRKQRAKKLKRQGRAKEKASILWLLSKAFNGHIPTDLKDPFYRDHDNVRRLKPKIVHSLANAELYCLALVNIYSDPNYNNLDHQGIILALTRKGICLVESKDAPLTETTLVQTAPIRLNAHMSVIDGIMCLFIKEVLIPEKLVEVCRKFSTVDVNCEMPSNSEEAAVLWINKCCKTLEKEIRSECSSEEKDKLPKIPVLQEISDISDGCCLAAVISYYCPKYLRWQDIVWNDPMSLGDSIHNLQLIRKFCVECLPREIHFFALEDLLYLHPSIKENVLAFVSDLLFMFVITKASCVSRRQETVPKEPSRIPLENSKSLSNFPSHKSQVVCSPIPNLRSDSYGGSTSSLPDIRPGSRTKVYGSKEKLVEKINLKKSNLSSEEIGPNQLLRTNSVGVVNGWKTATLPYVSSTDSASGSPRHTHSESRPAVEGESASSNFSQPSVSNEDINLVKHSPFTKTNFAALNSSQREQIYGLRKNSEGFLSCTDNNLVNGELRKARKSLEDYYNQLASVEGPLRSVSASNITENKGWRNCDKFSPRSHGGESVPESASSQSSGICLSDVDSKQNFSTTSFAQLSKLRDGSSSSINIVYMNHEKEGFDRDKHSTKSPSTPVKRTEVEGKRTTFAALPNTTTWQQQHAVNANANYPQTDSGHETPTEPVDTMLNAQLCNIKMKLEEKKRKIELKKKRMELLWKKQRQKLGKAAFLQAVSKSSNVEAGTPDSGTGKEVGEVEFPSMSLPVIQSTPSLVKKMSIQEIAEDLDNVQKKWLNQTEAPEQLSLPDSTDFTLDTIGGGENDSMNIDLQTSIEHLNTSLTDLQADISRISLQQEQVENLMKDSIDDCSHFFLHGQSNDNQFSTSPNRGPLHWQFNDSSFSLNREDFKELDSKEFSYLSSPQHQENRTPYISQSKMSSFASLPPCPSVNKAQPAEELYSKVIKPENRHKMQSTVRTAAATASVNRIQPSNAIDHSKPIHSKTSTEIHIVLPQVPDSKYDDSSTGKKTKDGFYIPIEKEVKKTKSKALKSKTTSDISCVPNSVNVPNEVSEDSSSFGFVIGADLVHPDPETETEMARKKEMIMNMSIQRKAEYERRRAQKEQEYARLKEEEQRKQELLERKREEEKKRREAILEQYRQRKLQEELEKEGSLPHKDPAKLTKHRTSVSQVKKNDNRLSMNFTKPVVELRNQLTSLRRNNNRREGKPRPRSAYVPMNSDLSSLISIDNAANKRNSHIFPGRDIQEFDLDSLNSGSTSTSSRDRPKSPNSSLPHHRNANLQIPEGSNPSSDGASDTASNGSSAAAIDYTGPKLFVKPTAKSNRGIIINAINTVLAGAVNADTKKKVLEEINRSDSKHFLILFRDAGCQFRALYTYNPEREEVTKLFGIGPKNITDKMMDRFYKYNSGGKCFSEIQTKHLTVTIDAFTIPNSLWAGKKVIPPKKEFF